MKELKLLRSLFIKANIRGDMHFNHTSEEDRLFLSSIAEPKDDIERSFCQYRCQMWNTNSRSKKALLNIAAAVITLPIMLRFRLRKNCEASEALRHYDAVMTQDFVKRGLMPDELLENLKGYILLEYDQGSLTSADMMFLKEIWRRYPLSFYFFFKCMCRIAAYSQAIKLYSPKAVLSYAEYSFTSSVLTTYCEAHNIQHINIMHGEKLFDLTNSFARFDKFYLWDEFYKQLFTELRATKTEYHIFRLSIPSVQVNKEVNRCVYYLQVHTHEQLLCIKDALEHSGLEYKVRPHPSYCIPSIISEVFGEEKTEDYKSVSIWDSLANAGMAVSINSTVLMQAYWLGVPIVIDNLSHPPLYKQLSDRQYILLNKEHLLLSDMIARS